ncbi:hypothetical protein NDU88_007449 [Pleurodeles waltl]|uniref:Uncharacterized protein n=1 Tax=Pleurodeles waltl TaxID=8319 RepID=A0AAV7PRF8_PLEWA|nr:hypothetical protein NDU88_007449 [Pleurodeles waltl]
MLSSLRGREERIPATRTGTEEYSTTLQEQTHATERSMVSYDRMPKVTPCGSTGRFRKLSILIGCQIRLPRMIILRSLTDNLHHKHMSAYKVYFLQSEECERPRPVSPTAPEWLVPHLSQQQHKMTIARKGALRSCRQALKSGCREGQQKPAPCRAGSRPRPQLCRGGRQSDAGGKVARQELG